MLRNLAHRGDPPKALRGASTLASGLPISHVRVGLCVLSRRQAAFGEDDPKVRPGRAKKIEA